MKKVTMRLCGMVNPVLALCSRVQRDELCGMHNINNNSNNERADVRSGALRLRMR